MKSLQEVSQIAEKNEDLRPVRQFALVTAGSGLTGKASQTPVTSDEASEVINGSTVQEGEIQSLRSIDSWLHSNKILMIH